VDYNRKGDYWLLIRVDPDMAASFYGEFVARCRVLRCLMIDAHSWKVKNFQPLVRAPALQLVGFNGLRPVGFEAISKANPKLFIGLIAANRYFQNGRPMTNADYLKHRRAFNKRYGV
jgi:hypothetical protein